MASTGSALEAQCETIPPATLDELFQFLQGQLRMELQESCGGQKLELIDKGAVSAWPDVEAFITPNLGASERWVPYHTILGVHELFLVQHIHNRRAWTERQRFQAMFVFRAHCKRDLFLKVQLPLMLAKGFWKDPKSAFMPGGAMEKAILEYRHQTGNPLITSCFRIIPPRVLQDNDRNLVRSITDRTFRLLGVADSAFHVMQDRSLSAEQKLSAISSQIVKTPFLGDTWAKMLTVCIDLAYPEERLLESQCEVGHGAAPALRSLLGGTDFADKRDGLKVLQKAVNGSKSAHAKHFWALLGQQEGLLRRHFKAFPLVCSQARTKERCMSAATLQVQLCEYRQFRSFLQAKAAAPWHGAGAGTKALRQRARGSGGGRAPLPPKAVAAALPRKWSGDHFVKMDSQRAYFAHLEETGKLTTWQVPFKAVGSQKMVARRVASMTFDRLRGGADKGEAKRFLAELVEGYRDGEDVDPDSEAWAACRSQGFNRHPVVGFNVATEDGSKVFFQTTQKAAGGSILEAERIARLCWKKLRGGESKEAVLRFRDRKYEEVGAGGGKRPRPASQGAAAKRQRRAVAW